MLLEYYLREPFVWALLLLRSVKAPKEHKTEKITTRTFSIGSKKEFSFNLFFVKKKIIIISTSKFVFFVRK